MANGKIRFGKQSGGQLALVIPDGVANTEVIVPESGTLVSVEGNVTDNAIVRFNGTTGEVQNSGIVVDDNGAFVGGQAINTAELITNGTFDINTNGWDNLSSVLTIEGQKLKIVNVSDWNNGSARQSFPTAIGKKYLVTFDITSGSVNMGMQIKGDNLGITGWNIIGVPTGTYSYEYTATTTTTYLLFSPYNVSAGAYGFIDNVSVKGVPLTLNGSPALTKDNIAYNVDTSSHIPNTLESGAIIERGSNTNGEYVKFADGTMICTADLPDEVGYSWATGVSFRSTNFPLALNGWSFPHIFNVTPLVQIVSLNDNGSSGTNVGILTPYYETSTTKAKFDGRASDNITRMMFIKTVAIGRWK